eukprot:12648748-Ditylum_brightwellii.AAC.1
MLNSPMSWKSRDPPFIKTVRCLLALQGRIFFKSDAILVQLTLEHVSSNNHVSEMESLCRKLWENW